MTRPPPTSPLFPYPPLSRSAETAAVAARGRRILQHARPRVAHFGGPAAARADRHHLRQHLRVQPVRHAERRSEEHTSELQSQSNIVCRLLLEKKNRTALESV